MPRDDVQMHAEGLTMDGSDYTHMHRAFLQAFLARSVMSFEEVKPVLAAVMSAEDPSRPTLEGDITGPLVTSALQTINARLAPLDYEIRSTRDQTSKAHVYALVNTTSDSLTQLATTFSPEEIAYIKRLLDCMFETNNTRQREIMAVSYRDAGRLAKAPRGSTQRQSQANLNPDDQTQIETQAAPVKGIDMAQSDAVLQTLVSQGFFRKSRVAQADYFSLAPRGLMELRAYLKETYNEPSDPDDPDDSEPLIRIRDCEGCREIVTVGVRCDNRDCGIRFHDACAGQYFRNLRGGSGSECPGCKTTWSGDLAVGPRAADVGGHQRMSGAAVGSSRMSGVRTRDQHHDEEDEEDE